MLELAKMDTPVTEIMTTELVTVAPQQKLIDVKRIFERSEFHHHIPVLEGEELKGIISLVDFMYAIKHASFDDSEEVYHKLCVNDIMTSSPTTLPSTSTFRTVAEELAKGNVHAVLIADNGSLKGIVSTADVIKLFLSSK